MRSSSSRRTCISAFDVILPSPVPGKGIVLNKLSSFWFNLTKDIVPNHMISEDLKDMPAEFQKPGIRGPHDPRQEAEDAAV